MLLYQKLLQMAQNYAFGKLVFMIHHQLFSLPSIHENVINRTNKTEDPSVPSAGNKKRTQKS